jgi:hypothetical protein
MLRLVALVRTDVSEGRNTSIIRVTRMGELGTLAVTDGGVKFLRNVGSYKGHSAFYLVSAVKTAIHP